MHAIDSENTLSHIQKHLVSMLTQYEKPSSWHTELSTILLLILQRSFTVTLCCLEFSVSHSERTVGSDCLVHGSSRTSNPRLSGLLSGRGTCRGTYKHGSASTWTSCRDPILLYSINQSGTVTICRGSKVRLLRLLLHSSLRQSTF